MRRFVANVLMLPGLLIIGFLAWNHEGTDAPRNHVRMGDILSHGSSDSQNHMRLGDILKQSLDAQESRVMYPWTDAKPIVKAQKIGVLSLPSLGVKNEPVVDDFTQAALDEGLIGSMGVAPGEVGNFAVIGHVITRGEIFKDLKKLRRGGIVKIRTTTGTFTYKIRGGPVTIVDSDTWVLRDNPSKTKNLVATKSVITLLTCAEFFHSNKRIAVFGDLVEGAS